MMKALLSFIDVGLLYFVLILITAVVLIFFGRKLLIRCLHPVKKARVQVVSMERQDLSVDAAARKLSTMPGQNKYSLGSSTLAHAMVENLFFTFYRLDRKNRKLRLKMPLSEAENMAKAGDIGVIEYQGDRLLHFEKTGNVETE